MKENKNQITKRTTLYLGEDGQKILNQKAQKLNISQSAYLREIILNIKYIEHRDLFSEFLDTNKLLLENMRYIGNNINQIASALHMNIAQSDESIVKEIRELQKLLNEYKDFVMNSKYPKLFKKRKFK